MTAIAYLSLKCKISAISLVETACIFLIVLIASTNINGMLNARKLGGIHKTFEMHTNLNHTYVGAGSINTQ